MPHLTIQATPNVTIERPETLLKTLNQALWSSGHFGKPTDIKSRMLPIDSFLVGVEDDEQEYGFIYAHLKLMSGRDIIARNQLAEILVTAINSELASDQSSRAALQICVEVEEISAVYHKQMLE